jgi:hypothetical protein
VSCIVFMYWPIRLNAKVCKLKTSKKPIRSHEKSIVQKYEKYRKTFAGKDHKKDKLKNWRLFMTCLGNETSFSAEWKNKKIENELEVITHFPKASRSSSETMIIFLISSPGDLLGKYDF